MFISYNFDREATDPTNYYFFEKGFSQEELDKIAKGIETLEEKKAETVGGGKDDVRSSKVRWIPQNENWWWLYEKLHDMAVEANNCLWKFDLTSLSEKIQYTENSEDDFRNS